MEYQERLEMLRGSELYREGAFTTTEAGNFFGMSRPGATALLNRMAEEGHLTIVRTINPSKYPYKYAKPLPNILRIPWRTVSNKSLRIKSYQFGVQV